MNKRIIFLFSFSLSIIICWFFYINHHQIWETVLKNYFMSLTMVIGSFIAGATSEGGGAVAFPVMTLIFKIKPHVARDFSLMIQSFGMLTAALAIILLKIKIVPRAIIYSSLGGVVGVCAGLFFLDQLFPPLYIKLLFTSLWLSFAYALYLTNKKQKIQQHQNHLPATFKNHLILITTGIFGGLITSLTGSGIDILTSAILVLYFNMDIKVATPTSVILMGINSFIGFMFKSQFIHLGMSTEAINYLYSCIPVVVLGAPLGAVFINCKTKNFIAQFLIFSLIIQYFSSLFILKPNIQQTLFSLSIIILGLIFFKSCGNINGAHSKSKN
jgi:uncharacterized membrane protein YfcA